jgi:hypothetical protein
MTHRSRPLATAPLALACALALATVFAAAARAEASAAAAPQDDHHAAMAAKHHEMMARVAAMDARVDELVATMNAAPRGPAKVDATAAAVTELAAQRKELRDMLVTGIHAAMEEAHGGGHHEAAKGHACMEHHGKTAGASCCAEGAECCSEGASCCAQHAAKGESADDGTCHSTGDAVGAAGTCGDASAPAGGPSHH